MSDARPLVAVVSNVQTPYRVHLHRRIVRELPEIRLASVYTHDQPDQPWERQAVPEINPVLFGHGQPVAEQSQLKWMLTDWRKGDAIIRWLRDQHAAAVVLGGYNDLTRLRIISWCHRRGVPCFLVGDSNIKGDNATGLRRMIKNAFVPWVIRRVSGVMPCGTFGSEYFARYGARSDRTYFFPYEPDYRMIEGVGEAEIAGAAAKFGLDRSRRRIVACARLVRVKRMDLLIDAFNTLAHERPEWDLLLIGDGPLRAELQHRVQAGLDRRISWTGFVGDPCQIAALYKASDVLVLPSDYEPWAVVLNEAAAAGLAIVASDVVGAAAELVRSGINGGTFPAGDLAALIETLRTCTRPDAISPLKQASREVLSDWRRSGDPVAGLRQGLRDAGVI